MENQTAQQKYNLLAILSIILAFIIYPVGLVLAIIALVQIKKTGEKGKLLAILAIILPGIIYAIVMITVLAIYFRPAATEILPLLL